MLNSRMKSQLGGRGTRHEELIMWPSPQAGDDQWAGQVAACRSLLPDRPSLPATTPQCGVPSLPPLCQHAGLRLMLHHTCSSTLAPLLLLGASAACQGREGEVGVTLCTAK